jgi:hypothetical protein
MGVFMSRSKHEFLAILPLFAILSLSPLEMETHSQGRSIASVEEVKASPHPKYEARAAKIDRSKIEVDKDMDLTCFKDRGDEFRTKLLKERKDYKVELVDKDGVAAQKKRLEDLVSGLVELEEDVKVLKEKKTWEAEGEEIAMATMEELKSTLESLLIDEVENDLNVLKADVKKVDKPVVIKEEAKIYFRYVLHADYV